MADARPVTSTKTPSSPGTKPTGVRGVIARAKALFERLRMRYARLDHAVRAFQHFGKVRSNMLAGAVTYFGMLSIFPILALAFAVIAYVARFNTGARDQILSGLRDALPGLLDTLTGPQLTNAAGAATVIGVVGLLYSGLGWLAALRTALQAAFEVPAKARRNAIVSKLVDLVALIFIGIILVASVGASSVVTSLTTTILDGVGLGTGWPAQTLLKVLGIALGISASTLLFFTIYRLLANPVIAAKSLWRGALVSAIGFEVLKLLATSLITSASSNPVYGSFAITVALLAWINYFARVTMLGAAWAVTSTSPKAALRPLQTAAIAAPRDDSDDRARSAVVAGAVIGASAVVFVDLLRRIRVERVDD